MIEIPSFPPKASPDASERERDRARRSALAELDRKVPSSETIDHPKIKAALAAYEVARADELAKRQDYVQAEQELGAARSKDQQALADALAAGKADPGNKAERKQLALIDESRRHYGASTLLLGQAVTAVQDAFAEHLAEWERQLEAERDELRAEAAKVLDEFERVWGGLQRNAAGRAICRGDHMQSPSLFLDSFRAPTVRDGDVVFVADVLGGLRSLAAPQTPSKSAVQNLQVGGEPTIRPLTKSPYAGAGASTQSLGARRDPTKVQEWVERDEAGARSVGETLAAERRAARLARRGERAAQREAQRDAESEAVESVR